jgi:hypothetical protein
MTEKKEKACFAIMPIADVDGYPQGHFKQVYDNLISPACVMAGFKPQRADEVKASNFIHLDILNKLLEAPIAICDLSTRNPNVMFELGIRQAFDKPVVLIQEKDTPKIFDITPLRYLEYSKDMRYHDVLKTQVELKDALLATMAADGEVGNVNSIVKLLALNDPAKIPDLKDGKQGLAFEIMQAEMREFRKMLEMSILDGRASGRRGSIAAFEYERISSLLEKLSQDKRLPPEIRFHELENLARETEEIMMHSEEKGESMQFRNLIRRIHKERGRQSLG